MIKVKTKRKPETYKEAAKRMNASWKQAHKR